MTSNYKRLGSFIEACNEKNDGNFIKELQGISNKKYFQKAKTNTIGIDLSKYRIVRTGQFAFNRATTRNGDKISIGLRQKEDCIVSPSYRIFKSKDENILNSEYLMMWFRRPEFDRYARFKSHGSAHEFFDYNEMCDVELPIPSIEKQQEIVKEYNTIVTRIKLNETLNQKLEETAQALYKHWFVDFEFPNEEGKPYKSSGGKMVYNEELDKAIPVGWEVDILESFVKFNASNYGSGDTFNTIYYYDTASVTNNVFKKPQILNIQTDDIPSRAKRKVKDGDLIYSTVRPNLKHFGLIINPKENTLVSTGFAVMSSKYNLFSGEFLLMFLSNNEVITYLQSKAEMSVSTYPSIKSEDIKNLAISIPSDENLFQELNSKLSIIFKNMREKDNQNRILLDFQNLLLSEMAKVEIEKEKVN